MSTPINIPIRKSDNSSRSQIHYSHYIDDQYAYSYNPATHDAYSSRSNSRESRSCPIPSIANISGIYNRNTPPTSCSFISSSPQFGTPPLCPDKRFGLFDNIPSPPRSPPLPTPPSIPPSTPPSTPTQPIPPRQNLPSELITELFLQDTKLNSYSSENMTNSFIYCSNSPRHDTQQQQTSSCLSDYLLDYISSDTSSGGKSSNENSPRTSNHDENNAEPMFQMEEDQVRPQSPFLKPTPENPFTDQTFEDVALYLLHLQEQEELEEQVF